MTESSPLALVLGRLWLPSWGRAVRNSNPSDPPGELRLLLEEDYRRGISHQYIAA